MPGSPATPMDHDAVTRFLKENGIDAFCIAGADAIRAPAERHPRAVLPSCRSVIIFGIVMPDRFFSGTDTEQVSETTRMKTLLESTALRLRDRFVEYGTRAEAILPSLPLKVENGRLRGVLSLKHCAADAGFGTLGDNTILIHPRYGNRLALAAVLTDCPLEVTSVTGGLLSCLHCGRCAQACPTGAIREGSIDITKCRNLAGYIPGPLQPLSWRLMQGSGSARILTCLLNAAGPHLVKKAACSSCITACPKFQMDGR